MKILILKPSSLGDVIQALPVLRLLKINFPAAEIFWWLDSNLLPLLQNDPDLAGIFPFHRRRGKSFGIWPEIFRSVKTMRQHRFDLVIDLQSLARSGTFAWLANGQTTIGLDDSREGARGFYDLSVTRPSSETHAVDWYLAVLQRLQVPINQDFIWLPVNEETKKSLRAKWKADDRRWILINPGARWANKRWPVEYFSTLVQMLASDFPQHHFAILGGPDEIALGEKITAMIPERTLDLTGQTSLREMVEWIRLGDFLVTNDTGPMHIGAALGTRVVSLFGPTNPRRTGPYGQLEHALHFSLPCSPCLKNSCANEKPLECLRAISPDQVRNEVLRRMC